MNTKLTPHQRIMRAAKARKGVFLTATEVLELSRDNAIATRADWDDHPDDEEMQRGIDVLAAAQGVGRG